MIPPASIAFAFWAPVTTGGFIAIAVLSATRDFAGTALLASYATLTLFGILYLNRTLIRRAVSEFEQQEGRETIGLLLREFEESTCDWLWETDERGRLTYVSNRLAQTLRADAGGLMGQEFIALLAWIDRAPGEERADHPALLAQHMDRHVPFRDVEVPIRVEGETVWWSLTGKPKRSLRHEFEGYRGVGSDVTVARQAHDRARFLAHYDELTGLANRRMFQDTLAAYLQNTDLPRLALLCLDLDRFKVINDTLGHAVGDSLLVAVARRLKHGVRETDLSARPGGDEFAVILRDADTDLAGSTAKRLVTELSKPYYLDGIRLEIGVSIGVALVSPDTRSVAQLVQNADEALYRAKADGRGVVRFSPNSTERVVHRRDRDSDLRRAIDEEELRIVFQPIFDLATGEVGAVEALLRWDRGKLGTVPALEFIPLAESSGIIDAVGLWALERACDDARRLPDTIRIAVNVSPIQLHDGDFVAGLEAVLARTGLAPCRLELELTETAFLDLSAETLDVLNQVRALSVAITLDDFGAGHSSLGQIRRFPFSHLKIDRGFIEDLPTNAASRAIVGALAAMSAELGIGTTAEGIETAEQLAFARSLGCTGAQGFLLARPMPLDDLLVFLASEPVEIESGAGEYGRADLESGVRAAE